MTGGRFLAFLLIAATIGLVVLGTIRPNLSGSYVADSQAQLMGSAASPQGAVNELLRRIGRRDWEGAYSSLANKGEFAESDFIRDLNGNYGSLRTYASLDGFDSQPLHASPDEAQVRARLRWAS